MPDTLASVQQPSAAAVAAFKQSGEVPHDLRCPITQEALVRPVRVGATGRHLYSEDAIVQWAWHKPVDPMTRESLLGKALHRDSRATAALSHLRRGAADIYMEEGQVHQARALHREADDCEARDARRRVAALPGAIAPQRINWQSVHTSLRVTGSAFMATWTGVNGYLWSRGLDPGAFSQLVLAGTASLITTMVADTGPRTQLRALTASMVATATLRCVVPTGACLLGLAVGVGIA